MVSGSGAPPGSGYVDQRHYVVATSLADLRGPASGVVTLDRWLDWSGDSTYDLDDAGDLQLMYQAVLNQATTVVWLLRPCRSAPGTGSPRSGWRCSGR
jgi:hypothetical protein